MPTTRRSRTVAAPVEELWTIVSDPHHLPRWWPRVERVEGVDETAFTQVMRTGKGRVVRADFDVLARSEDVHALTWSQRIAGTPFAAVLATAETDVSLAPAPGGATEVSIELRQTLAGGGLRRMPSLFSIAPRFGRPIVSRAAVATLEQALDGLERIGG